jgi:hypothetical protein
VSAHPTGTACAGCVHPRDDDFTGEIPTISFVSFWAGLVQALELILEAAGRALRHTRSTSIWPFGLENRHGFTRSPRTPPRGARSAARPPRGGGRRRTGPGVSAVCRHCLRGSSQLAGLTPAGVPTRR